MSIRDAIVRHAHAFNTYAWPALMALLDVHDPTRVEGTNTNLGDQLDTLGGVDWIAHPNGRRGVTLVTSRIQYDCEYGTITLRMSEYKRGHSQWQARDMLPDWRAHAYVGHTDTCGRHLLSMYAVRERDLHAYLDRVPLAVSRYRVNGDDGNRFIYPAAADLVTAGIQVRSVSYLNGCGLFSGYTLGGGAHADDLPSLASLARQHYQEEPR